MNAFIASLLNDVDARADEIFEKFKSIKLQNPKLYDMYIYDLNEQLTCAYNIGIGCCSHESQGNCSSKIIDILDECEDVLYKFFENQW